MEYLLIMAFSGSMMTVIYWLFRRLLRNKVSARIHYLLARAAVLYYLVPLPFLKDFYREIIYRIVPAAQAGAERIPLTWRKHVISVAGKNYVSSYTFLQTAAAVVWLLIVCLLMAGMLWDYVRTSRVIAGYTLKNMTQIQEAVLSEIKKQYGVKQHVMWCYGYTGAHTMTFGVVRPVIICARDLASKEGRLLVSHEMVHIKRRDVFWKMLLQFAAILHWWNPFVRILRKNFERDCECSCDEIVMQGKTEAQRQMYRGLLAKQEIPREQVKGTSLRWKAGFIDKQNEIQERIEQLKVTKKWNRLAAGMLAGVFTFANSMTVFAYRDTFHETAWEDMSQEQIESALRVDVEVFIPDNASQEEIERYSLTKEQEILFEKQFTDEEGHTYPIPKNMSEGVFRAGYSHKYVPGTAIRHNRKPDGGCEGAEYHARRCSCGSVIWDNWIRIYEYTQCHHNSVQ